MNKAYVYKIDRVDGLSYIGITINPQKRFAEHKKSDRFKIGIQNIQILHECNTYQEAEDLEEKYINEYNTYEDGLNLSKNGKGNHNSTKFTTKNHKFSNETKKRMSESAKLRVARDGPPKVKITDELRKKWSDQRKGICWGPKKINDSQFQEIVESYTNDNISFENDFIKKFVKKSQREKVGELEFFNLKCPNGKPLTKLILYSYYFSEKFEVTPGCIGEILGKQSRAKSYE